MIKVQVTDEYCIHIAKANSSLCKLLRRAIPDIYQNYLIIHP